MTLNKTKTILFLVFLLISFLSVASFLSLNKIGELEIKLKKEINTNKNLTDQIFELRGYQNALPTIKSAPSKLDLRSNESLTYFLEKIYSKFPIFQSLVAKENIKRVFQFPLSLENDKNALGGYLVEVQEKNNPQNHTSFYLVTEQIQKELIDPMSSYADANGIGCALIDYQIIGNEKLGRKLLDKNGYLILSGKCETYGGGRFISVYRISNAEKIMLRGNIEIGGTMYKGMSETGNALGGVRGIYGVNNPTLVIEFGNDDASAATPLERLSSIGFFDLQTGKLNYIENFK